MPRKKTGKKGNEPANAPVANSEQVIVEQGHSPAFETSDPDAKISVPASSLQVASKTRSNQRKAATVPKSLGSKASASGSGTQAAVTAKFVKKNAEDSAGLPGHSVAVASKKAAPPSTRTAAADLADGESTDAEQLGDAATKDIDSKDLEVRKPTEETALDSSTQSGPSFLSGSETLESHGPLSTQTSGPPPPVHVDANFKAVLPEAEAALQHATNDQVLPPKVDSDRAKNDQNRPHGENPQAQATAHDPVAPVQPTPSIFRNIDADSLNALLDMLRNAVAVSLNALLDMLRNIGAVVLKVLLDIVKLLRNLFGAVNNWYSVWKYLPLAYLTWLAFAYLTSSFYEQVKVTLDPICNNPWLGKYVRAGFPPCAIFEIPGRIDTRGRPFDLAQVVKVQSTLPEVLGPAETGESLSKALQKHSFGLRLLRDRVRASHLSQAHSLADKLQELVHLTMKGSRGLMRLHIRVDSGLNEMSAVDEYAAKALEKIDQVPRQNGSQTLIERGWIAINPFSLSPAEVTERQVKKIFRLTATTVTRRFERIADSSSEVSRTLEKIMEGLDIIQGLTRQGSEEYPDMQVLERLCAMVTRPGNLKIYNRHRVMLLELHEMYKAAVNVTQLTAHRLDESIEALQEYTYDLESPTWTLDEYPLPIIVSLFRNTAKSLILSHKRLFKYGDT